LQPNGAAADRRRLLLRRTIFCPDWMNLPAPKPNNRLFDDLLAVKFHF
jgi:hypothetical protein